MHAIYVLFICVQNVHHFYQNMIVVQQLITILRILIKVDLVAKQNLNPFYVYKISY